ncbi:MAG: PadR family transcriptional regulator [Algisphaera sp.]
MRFSHPKADASKRTLFRGSLDVLVLSVLAEGRYHGYVIEKQIFGATAQKVGAGTLYPLLHRMQAEGWVVAEADVVRGRSRKVYAITDAGRQALRVQAAQWQATLARMQGLVLPALRQITRHHPGASQGL